MYGIVSAAKELLILTSISLKTDTDSFSIKSSVNLIDKLQDSNIEIISIAGMYTDFLSLKFCTPAFPKAHILESLSFFFFFKTGIHKQSSEVKKRIRVLQERKKEDNQERAELYNISLVFEYRLMVAVFISQCVLLEEKKIRFS